MKAQRRLVVLIASLLAPAVPAATLVTIDGGPVEGHPSIAIGADGFPVIAYETAAGGLRLAHCRDIDCTTVSTVDIHDDPLSGMTAGRYNSVAIFPDGNPGIAFNDPLDVALKLVKCFTANCSGGGGEFRTIDPGPYVPINVALALDPNGKAIFAYQDLSQQALMLARCGNTGCGNVSIEVLAPLSGGVHHGDHAAIAIGENGAPVVSGLQWSAQNTALDYIVCADTPCVGPTSALFGAIGQTIDNPAMALRADSSPVFAYHGETEDSLMFGWCDTAACQPRHYRTLDDGSLGAGAHTAIAVRPNGRPVIAYQKSVTIAGGADALYVAECDDGDCVTWQQLPIDLQAGGATGVDPAIAIGADGGVVIAYFDESASSLMLAKCNVQSCEGPGDRIFEHGFEP